MSDETWWMIEATEKEIDLLVEGGYLKEYGPAWWAGQDETGMSVNHMPAYSHDHNQGVRFCRKVDAERVIQGWGYSLDNPWVTATEHTWTDGA